ncbi:hypothetical protein MXD81_28210 [Microbacteriaceae bacterium K1510]|nr:hypothetical protein [Microbacteriaceae bacterium K1510]
MADDLTPCDGLSDFWVHFAGLDAIERGGGATVRFDLVRVQEKRDEHQATLTFYVPPADDGVSGAIARGYDQLIDAMRQMIVFADASRQHYKKEAALIRPNK